MFGSVVIWAWMPILIDTLGRAEFDPYTQNFYRYLATAVFFTGFAALVDRRGLALAARNWLRYLAPAAAVVGFQTAWVLGIYRTTPTVAAFAEHSGVVFSMLASAIIFADERRVVGSWRFLAGAAAVAVGFAGVALGRPSAAGGSTVPGQPGLGVAFLVLGSLAWAVYGLLIKHVVAPHGAGDPDGRERPGPIPAFAATMALALVPFLALALLAGDVGRVASARPGDLAILFGSGIAGVAIGQGLYFVSIRRVGVATSQVLVLLSPFMTGLCSSVLFGERIAGWQWLGGAVLLAGAAGLVLSQAGARPDGRTAR